MGETREATAVINGEGDILCIVDKELRFLPFQEVNLDNIFIFWNFNKEDLETYLYSLGKYGNMIVKNIDIKDCTFLELHYTTGEGSSWWLS